MILKATGLTKRFQQGGQTINAVNNLNLEIRQGETVAIVGPSGSGKTTLLSLLAGLEHSDQGEIQIAGEAISKLTEDQLSRFRGEKVGIVFQQFHLMPHLSALENVSLPLDIQGADNVNSKASEALESVGLTDRADHLPNQLSGGECQRVAIARATVTKPAILFADEPSGNLDTHTGEKVTQVLFDLVKDTGMTLVLVTHDLELAKKCDRTLRIQAGEIQ